MTEKIAKAVIKCTFSFEGGREAEGFSAYDLMRHWAQMEASYADKDKTIWLDDETLLETEPWYPLKRVKLTIPGRDKPFISDGEMDFQYRQEAKKITQAGYVKWLLRHFDVSYEYLND